MLYGLPDDEFIAMKPMARIKHILKTDRHLQLGLVILAIVIVSKFI